MKRSCSCNRAPSWLISIADACAPRTVVSLLGDVPLWRSGTRTVHVRAAVLNLLDAEYAYNFGNPFSGTHFGAPRTVSLALRARF